jgi:hypothetical protein
MFAQGEQKIVPTIVPRTEQSACLRNQLAKMLYFFGAGLQCSGTVCRDVNAMRRSLARREINFAEVGSSN